MSNRGENFSRCDGGEIERLVAVLDLEFEEELEESCHEDGLAHALPADGHGRVANLKIERFQIPDSWVME